MSESFVARSLKKVGQLLAGDAEHPRPALSVKQSERLLEQLRECAAGQGGEVVTRHRAARLAQTYLSLGDNGRQAFLRLIALEFGPDPARVASTHADYQAAIGTPRQWEAEAALRGALRSGRIRILTQFNAIPQGVKFLVDLRADLLRYCEQDTELRGLDRELESRLSAWFDVGFLELNRITWHSPADLLEKLIAYEAVHAIRSWNDLKNRLDSDRRCYAFFHPRMPVEPLIFVEVALTDHLVGNVQGLLDEQAPTFDAHRADTAIFYSISNTQAGLRGVSFGNFLLKRVIDDLQRDFPRLSTFATLSPLPGLRRWVEAHPEEVDIAFPLKEREKLLQTLGIDTDEGAPAPSTDPLLALLADGRWSQESRQMRALQTGLTRLAARYLLLGKSRGRPIDPVARFHLGNGARIERLNPLGDTSAKGLSQSYGMMVNYLYAPKDIEANVEAFLAGNDLAAAAAIRRAARD